MNKHKFYEEYVKDLFRLRNLEINLKKFITEQINNYSRKEQLTREGREISFYKGKIQAFREVLNYESR